MSQTQQHVFSFKKKLVRIFATNYYIFILYLSQLIRNIQYMYTDISHYWWCPT